MVFVKSAMSGLLSSLNPLSVLKSILFKDAQYTRPLISAKHARMDIIEFLMCFVSCCPRILLVCTKMPEFVKNAKVDITSKTTNV